MLIKIFSKFESFENAQGSKNLKIPFLQSLRSKDLNSLFVNTIVQAMVYLGTVRPIY